MRFSKWHALGNSYLVVERSDAGALTSERARRLCDPSGGLDADGVLEVIAIEGSHADVVIWNPDGSTAEMSGNGTRIAARWLADRSGSNEVSIGIGPRIVRARALDETTLETDLGAIAAGARETLELGDRTVEFTPVSVGNPHAVVERSRLNREELVELGPLIETHPRFPERTNVQLVVHEGEHDVGALVWERGAGETSASGSSAAAVAAASIARGRCASPVKVHMPGGTLVVTVAGGRATVVGPAEELERGEIDV
jgi:diaminopimelate epimerase